MFLRFAFLMALTVAMPAVRAQSWQNLCNGKNLDGWEVRGESIWTVLPDGTLLGQRRHNDVENPFPAWPLTHNQWLEWMFHQSWLYTVKNYRQFDLQLEYFIPPQGNSGVSIRDLSRAHYAIGESDLARPDLAGPVKSTPAHLGYEIQIAFSDQERYPTASVYSLVGAKRGLQKAGQWNTLEIESRDTGIRTKLNGVLAAEFPGVPERSKTGPIGLQLHDQFSFVMFRNIRIREVR